MKGPTEEILICPKCGEEFPATTERGPGPAKAKFAAHCNKCEGKKAEVGEEVDAEFFVDDEPLKVGDQVMHGTPMDEGPVMTIEKIDDGVVTCVWEENGAPMCEAFSLLDLFTRIPATMEEVAQGPSPQQVEALEEGEQALKKAAAEQPRNFRTKAISQNLKCVLTNAEFLSRAKEMSQANSEIIRLEAELKSVKSQFNSQIDKHTATRDDMSRRVSEGCEWRDVECREYWDYDRHEVYAVREDTFETVSRRTMTTAEMQRGLDFMERQAEPGAE